MDWQEMMGAWELREQHFWDDQRLQRRGEISAVSKVGGISVAQWDREHLCGAGSCEER